MAYNEKASLKGGGKSKRVSMEIVADGTQANENPAAWYRGLGCITANNSSRLLLDYKVEHPKEYEEMMRLLFQKDYGVGLRHIKIELGADINSSSGTEPATKRSMEEPADVTRGAGFQFAADAKAINPEITLDILRWGEPGWVTKAFAYSQQQGFEARYAWYRDTLIEAYRVYGLRFDFISADANETDTADETWILYLRGRLDQEKDAPYDFQKIKLIASDEVGTRNIAAQMVENYKLRNAVDVIGLHYNTYGDSYTNLLNEAYGKEIWYSEGAAPCNLSHLTVHADGCGLTGKNGAIDVANRIINSYYNGKMCMYEFQPAIASYYDGSCYAPKHLICAWEPWSGNYRLDSGFWMAMHFNRFTPKGWMYVNGACYGDGEENHSITNTSNNFMTLVSPDRSEMTMHFTNEDTEPRVYSVLVKDMAFDSKVLSTVITSGPNPGQKYNENWFVRGKAIRPSHRTGETYLIKVPPQSIMTVTTLDTEWVSGVDTFHKNPPKSERLALPYADSFRYRPEELMVRGCSPRYMTDQGGAFELIHSDQDGDIVCQRITKNTRPTNWRFRGTPEPITCLGDDRWRSYSAEVDVRLDNLHYDNYAGLGIRYNSSVTCEVTSRCGYSAMLYGDGSWKLLDLDSVAAEGKVRMIQTKEWNRLKLLVLGDSILFFINGNMITSYRPQCIVNSGRVSLLSAYEMNTFRNLKVDPMPILPLYVRRVDCFSEGIFYNESWEVCPTEKYTFYNRTSMKALDNAAFSCKFTGTGIAVIGTAQDALFEVTVDDTPMYTDHFVSYCAPRQACIVIDQLPPGEHTLYVNLISGEFKLDVLEIPDNHVLMPDILTVTQTALAAAEKREQELYQQRLAQEQAARKAARTLEQVVESLADEPVHEEAAPKAAVPEEKPAAPAPTPTPAPEKPAEDKPETPQTSQTLAEAFEKDEDYSALLKDVLSTEFTEDEMHTDAIEAPDWNMIDTVELDTEEIENELKRLYPEEEEIIPEFADLTTPILSSELEHLKEEASRKTETAPEPTEASAPVPEKTAPIVQTEETAAAAETQTEPEAESEEEAVAPNTDASAEIITETVNETVQNPEDVYRSVTEQMTAEEPEPAVKPTPAPEVKSIPLMPLAPEESEDSPVFRPDFNIDIDIF